MKSGRYWHYWDSCIFLHWFTDPQKDAAVVDGIEDIVRLVDRGEAGVLTSVITRIEILRSRLDPKHAEAFFRLFARQAIQQVNVDPRIAQLSHDIRDFYASLKPQVIFGTADCIHLATAIVFEADEMNTLDGAGTRRRPNDLISLNGNVMGGKYVLPIRKPLRQQASILSGVKPLEIATTASEEIENADSAASATQASLGLRRSIEGSTLNEAGTQGRDSPEVTQAKSGAAVTSPSKGPEEEV